MKTDDIKPPTPYNDVNHVLILLRDGLGETLGDQLVGLYLTGSLTYGDFDYGSSDIDFLAVLTGPLTDRQRLQVGALHENIAQAEPRWAKRLEGSYIAKDMLFSTDRPRTPRPYINAGKFWDPDPFYGNEWTLDLFMLYDRGIALVGPDPKDLFPPVDKDAVREASKKVLLEDWQLKEPSVFENSDYDSNHLQAYTILTMCRILYTAKNHAITSKRAASAWAKKTYGEPWSGLIEKAENWRHGQTMNEVQRAVDFVNVTLAELK